MTLSLLAIIPAVDDVLFNFAQSDGFWANLETAFGTSYDVVKATQLRQQWQSRNFSQIPPIEVLSDEVLGTAKGAYSSSTNKIYLSASFLNTASSAAIVNVILEEIGHYVDAQVNQVDSAGDEGAIFAALVQGESLKAETLQVLKAEDDSKIINLNGEVITVEQSTNNLQTATGDGGLVVTVDEFGRFGSSSVGGQSAFYNPIGSKPSSSTTYSSFVALGIITNGSTGARTQLEPSASNNEVFTSVNSTNANSTFTISGLQFQLKQTVQDTFNNTANRTGGRLDQAYTITNSTTQTINFDLVRYVDGDLNFDGSISDGGGRIVQNGQEILFETDAGGTGQTDTTFFGISDIGGTIPTTNRWELDRFSSLLSNVLAGNSLRNTIVRGDSNSDQFIDAGSEYDVALALRNVFSLAPGQSTTYTTITRFGSGEAAQLDITPPTGGVGSLPATTVGNNINVTWSATDPSGIRNYDVFVSVNGGSFTQWQTNVTTTSAVYTGVVGSTYTFYSLATDNAGNEQSATTAPKTSTQVINPITLAISPTSVNEDGTPNLVYTFTRSGNLSTSLTTNFIVGGTATFNTDYTQSGAASFTSTAGTVTFAANSSTATVTVNPTADTTIEPNETVALTLAAGTGYTIGTTTPVTGTINNDDTLVTLAVSPSSVTEDGTTNLVYTFTRSGSTTNPLTVNYTLGGTATLNTDYTRTGTNNTVTFAANSSTATVTVNPTAETTIEPNETVILTLAAGTGYTVGTTTPVTGTINDDEPPIINLAVSPASVTEDGTTNLVYTFTRSGVTSNALTVNYTLGGTATLNTDYTRTGTNNTVTFAAGSSTATVTIDPTADTTAESNETVILTLAAGTGYTVGTTTPVTGTIFDLLSQGLKGQYYDGYFDDNLGFFSQQSPLLTRIDTNVNFLNNSTSWNLNTIPQLADLETFSSQWNGYINIPVTGNYTFYLNSDDASYLFLDNATLAPTPTNATINNGGLHATKEVSKTVNLTAGLHNILLLFGEKTVQNIMQFSWSSSDANIAKQIVPSSALFNDAKLAVGSLAFSSPTFTVNENGTPVTAVTVTRTGGSNGAVSATVKLTNGTATAPSDYNNNSITVNFANGEFSKTVTVPIVNDTLPEPDETVKLILTNPTGGATIGSQNTATLNIVDDDAAILITGFPQGSQGSNLGKSTIIIAGQNFSPTDKISIISPTGTETLANQVYWVNKTEAWATFNLQGLATGKYDVKVMNGINTYTSNDTFNVNNGSLGNLDIDLSYPAKGLVKVTYKNIGQTDLVAPLLRIKATNASVTYPAENTISATLKQLLNLSLATSDNGPAGILAPGEKGEFYFQYTPNGNGLINFTVNQVPANEVINWATIKAETRPDYSYIDTAAWDALWSNLTASLGTTAGQFQTVMAENANYLSQLGQETSDLTRLFAFEWKQAVNTLTNVDLISATDVVDSAPGLSLSFNRTFYQSIAERYNLGTLGRGWASQWDLRATTDSKGDVIIRSVGDLHRVFEKQTDGTFKGDNGASLTVVSGQYRLKEASGLVSLFGSDGKLNYVEDTNANRITLQYTNNNLTKLLHTNGDSLTLTYNAQGRINKITDSAGQATTYSYDASGENLLSVTGVDGTITYTYDTGNVAAKKYSLLSVKSDLGYQRTFEYDNQGRLTKESSNENTQTLTYSYDNVGGVTITDSTGASQTILLDDRGTGGQIRGVNNQNLLFNYDADGNLLGVTLPNGSQSGYTYDSKGNLTQQTNLLGQKTNFTYDATFNQLTGFTDPKGNGVGYSYDTKGNLNKITYSDGSTQQFTIDALGNITSSVNRRGSNISYTYNTSGLLTKKQYADSSSVTYGYDTKGNLTSVVDGTGTIAMQYDTANRLTKITYPNGRSLSYTYNADGQRTKLVSSDGYKVNYTYDTVGRLKSLTNGTGQNIISYAYDSAGRLIKETNGNGTYTTYEYDLQDQLTKLVNYKANNTVNSKYEYTYDNLGRRTTMTTLEGVFKYGYDAIGQLTSVITPTNRTITYTYDAAGNRIGVTDSAVTTNYTTNNLNQYTNVGNGVYTYDTDGNLISKTQGGQTSNYTYDAESRLVKVVTPSGTWEYQYDGLGNRTATIFNGQKTEYLVDPFGFGDVVGEYNNNSLVANYTHGIGLVSRVNGNNSNYYDADAIGSTVGLTATDGSYVNKYSYLPFGEDLTKVEAVANPFEYVGQWGVTDEGNGLDFMRARFYDNSLGRFTSADPIGLNGEDNNFYRYVDNNPVNYVDPEGLWIFVVVRIGQIALKVARPLGRNISQAVKQLNRNKDTLSKNKETAEEIARKAGGGKKPIHHEPREPGQRPHFHPADPKNPLKQDPNKGHSFYGLVPFIPLLPEPPENPENPQQPNTPNPKGGTYNDPHLKTLDGLGYDFQAVGEFTLVKSTTDDFEIQTRQQPWGSSTSASANTAISIKSGGQRIALYANQTNPLLINGTAVTLPEGGLYAVGQNLITRAGSQYSIITANNDLILVSNRGTWLNINLGLADNRQSKVIGLLGNFNNNLNDDFALRNGTVIGGTITDQRLYGDYAASWRITQTTSLFDYASGQTTATFTNLTFPNNVITTASLTPAQRAAAEQIARNAGITDPSVLEDVILDIHLSNGNTEFIQGAINGATNQQRIETVNAPNTIINPDGLGSQHLLPSNSVIPYTIRFSNNAAAGTTPVAQVTITQTLDSDLDLNTFTLDDINFGTLTLDVPTGAQNYSQRLDLRTTRGVFVDVNAGLNTSTRVLTWTFIAINPTTGNPANSTTQGFLPPNDANGSGRGFVGYSIQPKANSPSNTRIDAQASITFNTQTIQTNPVFNTLGDTSVTLAVSPSSVTEDGTNNLVYTFTRNGVTTNPLTVNYTLGGTATLNTDYTRTGTNNTVTFVANSTTATVTVDPKADTTVEPNETVILTLASGTGYTVGTTTPVTGTITNSNTTVTLAVSPSSVTEDGTTNLVYTFTRNGVTTNPLTVNYSISGTATNGTDYAALPTSIAFAAGLSTATVIVDPTTDTTVEPNETVALTLASGTGYTIGTTTPVTGTINNDDTRVTLAVSPSSITEDGTTNLVYTFTRTGVTTNALTVNYTLGGTATLNTDYTRSGTNNTVTFTAGSATATVTVDPTADTTVEPNETVALTLASGTGYTIGTTTPVTGTINNDDTRVTLAVSPSSITEDGTANLVYTFTRTGVTTNALTVNYTLGGTATLNTDYTRTGTNNTVTFAANATTATVIVDPTTDTTVEPNETVALTLASGTGYTIGTTTPVTGTINNDDTRVTLAVSPSSITEDGTANLVYTFTRTGVTTNPLTVNYTLGGTATLNTDYTRTGTNNTVTFVANATTATVIVDPTTDTTVEPNETVALTLASGTGYTIGTATPVTGTITNDDFLQLSINNVTVIEGQDNNATLTVTVDNPNPQPITVNYATAPVNATANVDYTGKTGTLTIPANTSTANITIPILNDNLDEPDEVFTVTLSNPTNAIINPNGASGQVIITDTLQSGINKTLPNNVENLRLIGSNNINGTGNAGNNNITGNSGINQINGRAGIDTLTGGLGADTFIFQFGQSTISTSDRITDFAINSDKIDLLTQAGNATSAPSSFSRAANSTVTTLDNLINQVFTDANGATTGNQGLAVNSAALVQVTTGAIAGTYLVINDSTAGFQASNDLLINITGFTGTLPALGSIPVSNFFV